LHELSGPPRNSDRKGREAVIAVCVVHCGIHWNGYRVKILDMEITLHIPDDVARRLGSAGGDVSRRALEALALEGYRDQSLTLYQVSEMLGQSRIETEDFLGRHHVSLSMISEEELDREAALYEAASNRRSL
jgi:predicted HTH domain antitoxin